MPLGSLTEYHVTQKEVKDFGNSQKKGEGCHGDEGMAAYYRQGISLTRGN